MKDLDDQKAKLERVAKQNAKYTRELRSQTKSKDESPQEVHVKPPPHPTPTPPLAGPWVTTKSYNEVNISVVNLGICHVRQF